MDDEKMRTTDMANSLLYWWLVPGSLLVALFVLQTVSNRWGDNGASVAFGWLANNFIPAVFLLPFAVRKIIVGVASPEVWHSSYRIARYATFAYVLLVVTTYMMLGLCECTSDQWFERSATWMLPCRISLCAIYGIVFASEA